MFFNWSADWPTVAQNQTDISQEKISWVTTCTIELGLILVKKRCFLIDQLTDRLEFRVKPAIGQEKRVLQLISWLTLGARSHACYWSIKTGSLADQLINWLELRIRLISQETCVIQLISWVTNWSSESDCYWSRKAGSLVDHLTDRLELIPANSQESGFFVDQLTKDWS